MENIKNINKMEAPCVSSENYKNGCNNVCLQKLRLLKFNSERKFQITNNKIKSKVNSRQVERKKPKMQTLHL